MVYYFKALITFYLCELKSLFLSIFILSTVSSKDWSFSSICIIIDFIVWIYGMNPSNILSLINSFVKEIRWKQLESK